MSKTHIPQVEACLRTLRKQASEVERHFRNIRETEVSLSHWEPELERLRKSVDVRDDSQLDSISRAKQRVDICKDVLRTAPEALETPMRNAVSGINALNECLRAASRDEREQLIQEATVALAPFAGTHKVDALTGEVTNPARKLAEQIPVLFLIPDESDSAFVSVSLDNMVPRRFVQTAETVITAGKQAITFAEAWVKAGGKFCTSKLQ